eukprot:TRINITY_DN5038_c0_g1_i1.p1 TRINITY_DN5038_c0_g1~~TRINITY_DN5038_c0_g1_i1.p1  ORF type:complete len:319 (+),score=87.10 TRINITY_DN5038_c0_g1_i1:52-1008(+)
MSEHEGTEIDDADDTSSPPVVPSKKAVKLYDNAIIIVAFLLVDEHDKVVLMQEAKPTCRGQWYIPAGKVDKNESLITAAQREMKEETGLEVEITQLCHIENFPRMKLNWTRYCCTGKITGGKLKTEAEQDKESLQAAWFSCEKVLAGPSKQFPLRGTDFFAMLESVREKRRKIPPFVVIEQKEAAEQGFDQDVARVILADTEHQGVFQFTDTRLFHRDAVLNADAGESFAYAAQKLLFEAFSVRSSVIGVYKVEHCGLGGYDGTRMTVLLETTKNQGTGDLLKFVKLEDLKTVDSPEAAELLAIMSDCEANTVPLDTL